MPVAVKLYRQAVERGNGKAMYTRAILLQFGGNGVTKDVLGFGTAGRRSAILEG